MARWLSYPYIAAVHAAAAEAAERRAAQQQQQQLDGLDGGADGGAEADAAAVVRAAAAAVDPLSMYDVLDYANCTACELALGDDVTAGAGHVLFDQVLPPGERGGVLLAALCRHDSEPFCVRGWADSACLSPERVLQGVRKEL